MNAKFSFEAMLRKLVTLFIKPLENDKVKKDI